MSLFRGLGLLVGYSHVSRDVTGHVDVSRPHPLYLNRNRSASAEISGYGLTEGALHLDLAYARAAGHLDWALFAGATLFEVEADLLGTPTYDDVYPYDELTITVDSVHHREGEPDRLQRGRPARLSHRPLAAVRRRRPGPLQLGEREAEGGAGRDRRHLRRGGLSVGAGLRVYF